METKNFIELFDYYSNKIEKPKKVKEEIEKIMEELIKKNEKFEYSKYDYVIEKCFELLQAIFKFEADRRKCKELQCHSSITCYYNLLEKIADIYLSIIYLQKFYNISDETIQTAILAKIEIEKRKVL